MLMDSGNLRLRAKHPQSHQGVCADAIASLEKISRADVDALALESQKRAARAIEGGYFKHSVVPVFNPDGSRYSDPGVRWVAYFNGGDAVHQFPRPGYGYPQSLGCVELPSSTAESIWAR